MKIFDKKYILILFLSILLISSICTNTFAMPQLDNLYEKTAAKISRIVVYNLEWCVLLIIPTLIMLTIGLILFKQKKKVAIALLVLSFICCVIITFKFVIYDINFEELTYYLRTLR